MPTLVDEFRNVIVPEFLNGDEFGQNVTLRSYTGTYTPGTGTTARSPSAATWRASPVFGRKALDANEFGRDERGIIYMMASGKVSTPDNGDEVVVGSETWVIVAFHAIVDDGTSTGAGVAAYKAEIER